MKKFSILIFLFFFIFQSNLSAYSSNPKDFIEELVNDAIENLADKNLNKEQKAEFVEQLAINNVDIKALGLYTLGELRKSADKQDLIK